MSNAESALPGPLSRAEKGVAEHCCGIFVTSCFRHRWDCPTCGRIWAWDEDAVEWVPTAQYDGDGDGS